MFELTKKLLNVKGRCFYCRTSFEKKDVPKNVYTSDGTWKKVCDSCHSGIPQNNIRRINGTIQTRKHAKKLADTNRKKKGLR